MTKNRSTNTQSSSVRPHVAESSLSEAQFKVAATVDTLKMGDFQARWEASKLLAKSGAVAIEPLLVILGEEDSDWELLWFVARILGNIAHPAAVSALVNLLATATHEDVAGMAATALAHHGTTAIAPLTTLLQQEATRLFAVKALAQIRHPEAISPLLTLVSDPDPAIRAAAIEALSHFHTPAVSTVLLTALADMTTSVRKAAVIGLGIQAAHMDTPELGQLTQHLQERLRDFNLDVCCQAAIALGRIGTNQAADALFEVLQSPHTPVALQLEAVRALSRIDTPHALESLHFLIKHSVSASAQLATLLTSDVQQEILAVLGRTESPKTQEQATQILLDLLHRSGQVLTLKHKQTIALSLGQLGQPIAIDALIHLLADSSASVRFHAIAALKQLDWQQSYQRLHEYADRFDLDESFKQGLTIAIQEWMN